MKRVTLIAVLVLILASCGKPEKIKQGDKEFVVIGSDTLGIIYETHVVKSCDIIIPRSIHEEMNPEFKVVLEDGSSFESRKGYNIGDSIVYTIYQK